MRTYSSEKSSGTNETITPSAVAPMFKMMTVSTQRLEIVVLVIFSIVIEMMNNQIFNSLQSAALTGEVTQTAQCRSITTDYIVSGSVHRTIRDRGATAIAKSFSSTLKFDATRDDCAADLAWMALNTGPRTIQIVEPELVSLKFFPTRGTVFLLPMPPHMLIPASFRTTHLPLAPADVFPLKFSSADRADVRASGRPRCFLG
jgi:hypothetical protein